MLLYKYQSCTEVHLYSFVRFAHFSLFTQEEKYKKRKGEAYLNYEEFLQEMEKRVRMRVGKEVRVCIFPVRKNNSIVLDGLTILEQDHNLAPVIYLNTYYQDYLAGVTEEQIADRIVSCFHQQNTRKRIDVSFYTDPLQVKERIVCRLINYEKNRRLLEEIPYRMFLNLAVVYYYLLECGEIGPAVILVRNEHMRMWEMNEAMLHAIAEENTRKLLPCDFMSMGDMMNSMMTQEELQSLGLDLSEDEQPFQMYVLTNQSKSFGAIWMTDENVLEEIGNRLMQDYYILPSSVHECMVVPVKNGMDEKQLQEMVREINETQVDPEEVLGDTVYRYSRQRRKLLEVPA